MKIKEWHAVAAWRWQMPEDDVCGICRNPYDSTCSKCKFPGDDCPLRMLLSTSFLMIEMIYTDVAVTIILTIPVVLGQCGHSFHKVRDLILMCFTSD